MRFRATERFEKTLPIASSHASPLRLSSRSLHAERWFVIGGLICMAIGAFLRFYGLETQSLWHDELSSWLRSSYPTFGEVWRSGILSDVHPPGYHIILFIIEHWFGVSETWLRLPSALAGTLAMVAMFRVGQLLYSAQEGWIAASLLAFLYTPLYYSQEARPYALLLCACLFTLVCWLQIMHSVEESLYSPRWTIGYVLSAAIACYSHYFGVIFVFFLVVWVAFYGVAQRQTAEYWQRYWLMPHLSLVLLYAPWLLSAIQQFQGAEGAMQWSVERWLDPPFFDTLLQIAQFYFGASYIYHEFDPLVIISLGICALGLMIEARTRARRAYPTTIESLFSSSTPFVLYMSLGVITTTYLASLMFVPVFTDRNLIITLPFAYLLLARSITRIAEWIGYKLLFTAIAGLLLIVLHLLHLLLVANYYTSVQKEQYREAVAYVIKHVQQYPNGVIVAGNSFKQKEYFNYYFRRLGSPLHVDVVGGREIDIERITKVLSARRPDYIWFLTAHRTPERMFVHFLDSVGNLRSRQRYLDSSVRLYHVK